MSQLQIKIEGERTRFAPGETIAGSIEWVLEGSARALEWSLSWSTRGKGERDSQTITSLRIDDPPKQGSRPFEFRLPEAPSSFEGKLVSLCWQLVLSAGGDDQTSLELVIGPGGRAVDLYRIGAT